MTKATSDSADDIIALVQLCGLPGYKSGTPAPHPAPVRKVDNDEQAIRRLIRETGLAGYDPDKLAASSIEPIAPEPSTPPAGSLNATEAIQPSPNVSKQQFLVLDVAPGGESALAALESKIGMSVAVERHGKPSWVAASNESGGSRRAFSFMAGQVLGFADLLGELGTSALRLSVTGVELSQFKAVGAGVRDGHPPQWPDSLNKPLRAALGK